MVCVWGWVGASGVVLAIRLVLVVCACGWVVAADGGSGLSVELVASGGAPVSILCVRSLIYWKFRQ